MFLSLQSEGIAGVEVQGRVRGGECSLERTGQAASEESWLTRPQSGKDEKANLEHCARKCSMYLAGERVRYAFQNYHCGGCAECESRG